MSEEYLQKRVEKLEHDLAEANAEAKKHRLAKKQVSEEFVKYKAGAEKAIVERDELRQRAEAAPSEVQAELDRLKGENRNRDHRSKFDEVARSLGVSESAVKDLWTLSGYAAEKDQPDETAMKTLIEASITDRPYLLAAPQNGSGKPSENLFRAAANGVQAGPGADRGVTQGVGFVVRKTDLQDITWVRQNQAKMNAARKDGTLQFIEDY